MGPLDNHCLKLPRWQLHSLAVPLVGSTPAVEEVVEHEEAVVAVVEGTVAPHTVAVVVVAAGTAVADMAALPGKDFLLRLEQQAPLPAVLLLGEVHQTDRKMPLKQQKLIATAVVAAADLGGELGPRRKDSTVAERELMRYRTAAAVVGLEQKGRIPAAASAEAPSQAAEMKH